MTNDNVVTLPKPKRAALEPAKPKPEPHEGVVALLQDLLNRANAADVHGVAVVWSDAEGETYQNVIASEIFDEVRAVGAVKLLSDSMSATVRGE